MEREAIQAVMGRVIGQTAAGCHAAGGESLEPHRPKPRAYSPAQVRAVSARPDPRNALATEIVHASGIRAHELLTLGRPDEQPPGRPSRPVAPDRHCRRGHEVRRPGPASSTPWRGRAGWCASCSCRTGSPSVLRSGGWMPRSASSTAASATCSATTSEAGTPSACRSQEPAWRRSGRAGGAHGMRHSFAPGVHAPEPSPHRPIGRSSALRSKTCRGTWSASFSATSRSHGLSSAATDRAAAKPMRFRW